MANICDINTGRSTNSHLPTGTCIDIYHQNVRGLRTEQFSLYGNICFMNYHIICLPETRLNDFCFDHDLFSDSFTFFHFERMSTNKTRGGGGGGGGGGGVVVIALPPQLVSVKAGII
jgi:hypothetical protein